MPAVDDVVASKGTVVIEVMTSGPGKVMVLVTSGLDVGIDVTTDSNMDRIMLPAVSAMSVAMFVSVSEVPDMSSVGMRVSWTAVCFCLPWFHLRFQRFRFSRNLLLWSFSCLKFFFNKIIKEVIQNSCMFIS